MVWWPNIGEGALLCPLTFHQRSRGLSYIFLITVHPATFVTLDDPTLLHHRILVLGGHQEVFDGGTSSKIYLYTIVAALFLDSFTQHPIIWNSYVWSWGVLLLCFCYSFSFSGLDCSSSFLPC